MACIDKYGVEYSEDKKKLVKCPGIFEGGYTIEGSVTEIGFSAFSGCTGLTSIEIPNSVTEIGCRAFKGCTDLSSIDIPNSVTKIGELAFHGCISLKSIEIPDCVTEIEGGLFKDCSNLMHVRLPQRINRISEAEVWEGEPIAIGMFENCISLQFIEIPNSVTEIGYNAFLGCTALTSIEFPNSLTKIECSAFEDCTALASIDIPNSVTEISASAFAGCASLTSIYVDDGNSTYDSRGNCNAIIETITNKLIVGCKDTTLPYSVTMIGEFAFCRCAGLTSIEILNSVTEIGYRAFFGCAALTSIEIPNSVTKIEYGAFEGSVGLKELHIRHEHPEEINVPWDAFEAENCTLYVPIGTGYAYRHHPVFGKFKEVVIESSSKKGISPESFANGIEKKSDVSQTLESKKVEDTITQPSIVGGSANPNDIGVVSTIVFFDTETTGVPQNYKAPISDSSNWPRLVQLAWIVWDKAHNRQIKEKSLIVSPDGFVIPKDASNIHGITHDRAKNEGHSLYSVLSEFMSDVQTATHLVGHNIDFDRHVVGAELYRMKMSTSDLMDIPYTCTMQTTIDFCKLPPYNYGHYKFPKLQELYHKLFGNSFSGAHDALADIRATKDCYFELVKRGVIKDFEGFDVFISYAVKDYWDENRQVIPGNIVSKVQNALRSAGITYWIDKEGLLGGHTFPIEIAKQIKNAKAFIFISSVNSNQSEWVMNEIATAREYGKTIIPFRADNSPYNTSLMIYLAGIQYIFYQDNPLALKQLVDAVKKAIHAKSL